VSIQVEEVQDIDEENNINCDIVLDYINDDAEMKNNYNHHGVYFYNSHLACGGVVVVV